MGNLIFSYIQNQELSNTYPCRITLWGLIFNNAEQCYQYQKAIQFKDYKSAIDILACDDPQEINQLGRNVKNFNEDTWYALRDELMKKILIAKFHQNQALRRKLDETRNDILINSYHYCLSDKPYWGVVDQAGENMLGRVLMDIRTK